MACVATDDVERVRGGNCGVEGAGLPDFPGVQLAEERIPAGPGAAERAAAEDHHNCKWAAANCERLVGHCAPHQLLWGLAHGVRYVPPPLSPFAALQRRCYLGYGHETYDTML